MNIADLINDIERLLDSNDGLALSTQAGKLAIELERLLETKADAKHAKNVSYAKEYDKARQTMSMGDAKVYADARKNIEFEKIEALESGIKAVLSTVKSKLDWLKLEHQSGRFD
jgi:ferredoxin-like protein FixX